MYEITGLLLEMKTVHVFLFCSMAIVVYAMHLLSWMFRLLITPSVTLFSF